MIITDCYDNACGYFVLIILITPLDLKYMITHYLYTLYHNVLCFVLVLRYGLEFLRKTKQRPV